METKDARRELHHRPALETSLVEWKPRREIRPPFQGCALGNFLSGMETWRLPLFRRAQQPLETSLVEWKQTHGNGNSPYGHSLETSLVEWKRDKKIYRALFLPSLETSLVEWKLAKCKCEGSDWLYLGNFLSGMETDRNAVRAAYNRAPWKLP